MPKRYEFKTKTEWLEHLRLWFAGMALQGSRTIIPAKIEWCTAQEVAAASYAVADAMLSEREKNL